MIIDTATDDKETCFNLSVMQLQLQLFFLRIRNHSEKSYTVYNLYLL